MKNVWESKRFKKLDSLEVRICVLSDITLCVWKYKTPYFEEK